MSEPNGNVYRTGTEMAKMVNTCMDAIPLNHHRFGISDVLCHSFENNITGYAKDTDTVKTLIYDAIL